uniref:Uncharacterized protein n=1 Tax=Physcomitrium patens TaxID=3218 RepID=A0A2K1K1H3_PHYPA|nr:hypothetical protein PHYPA_012090 [Physcomitrium patens]
MCLRKTKKQLPGRLIARYHPGKIPMELVEPHFDKILTGLDGNKSDEDHDENRIRDQVETSKIFSTNKQGQLNQETQSVTEDNNLKLIARTFDFRLQRLHNATTIFCVVTVQILKELDKLYHFVVALQSSLSDIIEQAINFTITKDGKLNRQNYPLWSFKIEQSFIKNHIWHAVIEENIAMSENFILFNQLLKQLTFMNVVFTDEELLNIIIDALPPISQTFGLVIMGREIQPT